MNLLVGVSEEPVKIDRLRQVGHRLVHSFYCFPPLGRQRLIAGETLSWTHPVMSLVQLVMPVIDGSDDFVGDHVDRPRTARMHTLRKPRVIRFAHDRVGLSSKLDEV